MFRFRAGLDFVRGSHNQSFDIRNLFRRTLLLGKMTGHPSDRASNNATRLSRCFLCWFPIDGFANRGRHEVNIILGNNGRLNIRMNAGSIKSFGWG